MVVIWDGEIFILNPLPHSTSYPELEKAVSRGVQSFNIETGRGSRIPKIKYIPGCPKQPGGYVIMRYLKDITEDPEMSFVKKWATRNRRTYEKKELDEVRCEALDYIQGHM